MRAASRAAPRDARSGSRPQPPPRPPMYGSGPESPATSSQGASATPRPPPREHCRLAPGCRPTSRAPVAAVLMGGQGPGDWTGCEEPAVARFLLPEDGRKWLRCLAGGGQEREGRAGPQGVEGVGPAGGGDPAPAWSWSWEGRGSQPGSDGRGPGKEPVCSGGTESEARRKRGIGVLGGSRCHWAVRTLCAGFRRKGGRS